MMSREPKKHHYIPQFILKNFSFDEKCNLFYFDRKTYKICEKSTRDIFMVRNLYRDEINNPDEPTKIEKDMACFESEISRIITGRFLNRDEIAITLEEDEKLKLFFAIMGFRSKNASDKFGADVSDKSRMFYSMYQENGDLSDFWRRNLGNLVNCRSLKEIADHKTIDDPIKIFFLRDMFGCFGRYFVVAERRGPLDFIISDAYPTVIKGVSDRGLQLDLFSIFPISSDRILLLVNNGIEGVPKNILAFSDDVLKKPKLNSNKKSIIIRTKKIYENEVRYVNSELIMESNEGFAFRDKNRVIFPEKGESVF